MDINIEKIIMICHIDREVHFKCNIFCPKTQNEDIYFKCKKSMIVLILNENEKHDFKTKG